MARINLEILLYLIWTKLLAWTRCPQRAGSAPPAAQMGKEWSADLWQQPRWAHEPLVCWALELSFYTVDQKCFFVILGLGLYSQGQESLEENPEDWRVLLSLFLCPISCYLGGYACVLLKDQKTLNKDVKIIEDDLLL